MEEKSSVLQFGRKLGGLGQCGSRELRGIDIRCANIYIMLTLAGVLSWSSVGQFDSVHLLGVSVWHWQIQGVLQVNGRTKYI